MTFRILVWTRFAWPLVVKFSTCFVLIGRTAALRIRGGAQFLAVMLLPRYSILVPVVLTVQRRLTDIGRRRAQPEHLHALLVDHEFAAWLWFEHAKRLHRASRTWLEISNVVLRLDYNHGPEILLNGSLP